MDFVSTLIEFLFDSLFGLLVVVGVISAIYRQLTRSNGTGGSLLEGINRAIGNTSPSTPRRDVEGAIGITEEVVQVGSSSINPNIATQYQTFTEKDMYINQVEEVMTYSATQSEPYANPKELLDAGLITAREYREMVTGK